MVAEVAVDVAADVAVDMAAEVSEEITEDIDSDETSTVACDLEAVEGTLFALAAPDRELGEELSLCGYHGGVVLIVNIAAL